jgi:hypothetical protein
MSFWKSGEIITAAKMEPVTARYVRSSGTQNVPTITDTQVQFPTASLTSTYITPGGTGNNFFTIASGSGVWMVTASQRVGTAHATWEMSIAVGSSVWSVANVKKAGSGPALNIPAGSTVVDATAAAKVVCCGTWQSSGSTFTITAFGEVTSIDFVRIA